MSVSGTCRGCVRTCRIRGLRRQFPTAWVRLGFRKDGTCVAADLKKRRQVSQVSQWCVPPCTSTQLGYLELETQGHGQGQGLSPRPPVQPPVIHLGVQSTTAPAPKWTGPHLATPSRGQYVLWVTGSTGRCLGLTLITGDLFPSSLLRSRPLVIPSLFFLLAARFAASTTTTTPTSQHPFHTLNTTESDPI